MRADQVKRYQMIMIDDKPVEVWETRRYGVELPDTSSGSLRWIAHERIEIIAINGARLYALAVDDMVDVPEVK